MVWDSICGGRAIWMVVGMAALVVLLVGGRAASIVCEFTPTSNPPFTGKWVEKADTLSAGGYGEAVVGINNNVYVVRNLYVSSNPEFWCYDPSTDSWSSIGTSGLPLGAFRTGTALAWDHGNYIYALLGARYPPNDINRRLFYRYSITNNNWEQLADTPHAQGAGDAITWSGYDGYIYAIIGSAKHGTAFARYKYNSWEVLDLNPNWTVTDDGASLAWTGGEYLYALHGEYAETVPNGDFARYRIPSQTWVDMKDIPEDEGIGDGASLLWVGEYSDDIFALGGGDVYENPGYNFYSYSISTDGWEQLESIPCPIGYYVGNRLGFANGNIYYWQGAPTTDKWICGGDAFYMFKIKSVPSTNITVCPIGCDYTGIQAAINASNPGGTILVYSGTYYENVNVNKQVILRGIDTGGGKPVVNAGGSGSAINITADGTILEGFHAKNSKTWPYAGIEVVSNSNTIRGNIISNSNFGIYLTSSNNNTITGNVVSNNFRDGIYLTSSGNNTLRNNLMSGNLYNFGVWGWMDSHFDNDIDTSNLVDGKPVYYLVGASGTVIDSSSGAGTVYCIKCDNVTVKDLILINNSNGISFYQTRDSKIQNNYLSNNGGGVSFYISSNNTITSNNASSNWDGISIQSSSDNIIVGNSVSNNFGYAGSYLGYSDGNILSGNNASNNRIGIVLYSSSNNTLNGNIANSNNDTGIFLYFSSNNTLINNNVNLNNGSGIFLGDSNNLIYHNNFINNTQNAFDYSYGLSNLWNANDPTGGNYWSDYTGVDLKSGPSQNIPGSDGIGDTPYNISGGAGAQDRYPFMRESGWLGLDITPPASVTILKNITYATTYINWTWNDPADSDFDSVIVYIDDVFKSNVSKGVQYYNATGFASETEHSIATRTVDISGNVNQAWVNHTARTAPLIDTTPPTVSNPNAIPSAIPDDTDNVPLWGETSQLNVTVSDDSGVASVTINLSALGKSEVQPMTRISGNNTSGVLSVTTNASTGKAGSHNLIGVA